VIDGAAATLAFRNRALTVSVATTGSTSLSATALGFARASGSFITDGFYPGMEVVGTGFSSANNASTTGKIITDVATGFLTISGGCTAQSATSGRTLAVSIPKKRAWENISFEPTPGHPYVSEQFIPATTELKSITAIGGTVEETGFYVLTLYGLENYAAIGIRKQIDAIKLLFTPGTNLTAGSHTIKIRGDTSTKAGQIIPLGNGWATCQLSIPWRAFSINAIAA
jgi:hypothetical protein